MKRTSKKELFKIIRTVLAVCFGFLMIAPVLFMVSTSFKENRRYGNMIFSGYRSLLSSKIISGFLQICLL